VAPFKQKIPDLPPPWYLPAINISYIPSLFISSATGDAQQEYSPIFVLHLKENILS